MQVTRLLPPSARVSALARVSLNSVSCAEASPATWLTVSVYGCWYTLDANDPAYGDQTRTK